ncbi:MAG TPA: hypothetical protein VER11_18490 [Polyangiaceae bacterium]|nr:hypothetical protein [Polyangiaceae bacterium]
MTSSDRYLSVLALLLFAGCADETAGGQSGTDANGGYHCDYNLEGPMGAPVPLDQPVAKTGISPNQYYDVLEGNYRFVCSNGARYSVSVTRGAAARRVLGILNESQPDPLCEGLQQDATVHVEALDGSWSHDSTFVNGTLSGLYAIGGQATDANGSGLWLTLEQKWTPEQTGPIERLRIDRPAAYSLGCVLEGDQTGEGGSGGDSP